MSKKQDEKDQFYTGEGVNVSTRVTKGKTKVFKSRIAAESHAGARRSYTYEMFDAPAGNGRNFIGYGVPS